MILYIIRHGQTDWNKEHRLQGQSDIELNSEGIRVAQVTAEGLKDVPFTHIFSSPLVRARKTAEILCGDRNIKVVTDDRLKEVAFGVNEGYAWGNHTASCECFFNDPCNYVPEEGAESYDQLIERTGSFLNEVIFPLAEKTPDAVVLISAHGAINKILFKHLKNLPLSEIWNTTYQKNCAFSVFEIKKGTVTQLVDAKSFE